MIFTVSRSPTSSKASIVFPMFGMVVVRSADIPRISATVLHHRVNEFVRFGVHTQVVNHETGAAQHHDAEILADVVQVTLDRAHDDRAHRLDA